MIHPIQWRDQYVRKGAAENNVTMAEYDDCMDEQACFDAWFSETLRWLTAGEMNARWWNAVLNHPTAHALVMRWMKDNPILAREKGHDMACAMAHVRKAAP